MEYSSDVYLRSYWMFKQMKDAIHSDCDQYRYMLLRRWEFDKPMCTWIMLNPSTADENYEDPTMRKCIGFSKRMGFGGMRVVNLFAWKDTDPALMKKSENPVGPLNDDHIITYAGQSEAIICGWGTHGGFLERDVAVKSLIISLEKPVYALEITKEGYPKHPLYVSYDKTPINLSL